MLKSTLISLLVISIINAQAQTKEGSINDNTNLNNSTMHASSDKEIILIYVKDTALIQVTPAFGFLNITSTNPTIQAIFNNYVVYRYEKAFSASRFPSMHSYYEIEANSTKLMTDLLKFNNFFSDGSVLIPKVNYTPNVFYNGVGSDKFLSYIGAPAAWDNADNGDPNVIVGITDTKFDLNNPDLVGTFVQVRSNSSTGQDHGTGVAGFVAANTNNNFGVASIGHNCRLDLSNRSDKSGEMLQMSSDGRRILNASWMYFRNSNCTTPYIASNFNLQRIYDEIYENGTIAFFGAGNSATYDNYCGNPTIEDLPDLEAFQIPASFNHNMSISSVGIDNHNITTNPITGLQEGLNWADCHRSNVFKPLSSFHHNSRVDLVAPGYWLPYLSDASTLAWNGFGTSYSSPIAAGTAALMLSIDNCLSPYQIEYVMKKTAKDIYSISENSDYIGKLGAGALQADKATLYVKSRKVSRNSVCNDPNLKTFIIKGIEFNTICAPGSSSNGALPKLAPILENGTPNYTYQWEAFPDNEVSLDDYSIASPTVISATGTRLLHLYLTVYDQSEIQKIANKEIRIQLKTSGYDLAMRDLFMDMLDEPNNMATYDPRTYGVWKSPDIWNRWTQDGIYGMQQPFLPK